MSTDRNPSLSRLRVLSILSLALVAVLAFPTPARAVGDYVGFEGAPWAQSFDGEAAIDSGSTAGTTIDFNSTLGLGDREAAPAGRVWFRLGKSRLILDFADSSRTGSEVLTQSYTFNGNTYSASENVDSSLDMTLLQGQYRYSIVDMKVVEFGFGVGFNVAQINMELNGSSTGLTTFDEDVPFPTGTVALIVKPFPGFHIRGEVNGVAIDVGGNAVDIFDARLQVEYYFLHSFGIFGGYRSFSFDVDANDFGHVESSFKGPYLGLGLKF